MSEPARAATLGAIIFDVDGAREESILGTLPKPLKRGLLWTTAQTRRGRIHDVIDDVFRFAYSRYFVGEVVEAVIGDMWCDSTILKVIPPTQEEIDE